MKSKYLFIAIASLSFSTSGFAQSSTDKSPTNKTNSIESVQLKSGPLADFYELVSQHRPSKQTQKIDPLNKAQLQDDNAELLVKLELELANNTKTVAASKP
jgi:hypothetical protein